MKKSSKPRKRVQKEETVRETYARIRGVFLQAGKPQICCVCKKKFTPEKSFFTPDGNALTCSVACMIQHSACVVGTTGPTGPAGPTALPLELCDAVNPPHYRKHPSGVECIQITEHMNFCRGNAVKYIWRAGEKGSELEDLRKAKWYLEREIARVEKWRTTSHEVLLTLGDESWFEKRKS